MGEKPDFCLKVAHYSYRRGGNEDGEKIHFYLKVAHYSYRKVEMKMVKTRISA